jgi:hypothetical protein
MPEIARFYGLIIKMFYKDHFPPHFHVEYGEFEGVFDIKTLEMFEGELPARAKLLAIEWAILHRKELEENWERRTKGETIKRIEPLP